MEGFDLNSLGIERKLVEELLINKFPRNTVRGAMDVHAFRRVLDDNIAEITDRHSTLDIFIRCLKDKRFTV
jgi:hypothetical protein